MGFDCEDILLGRSTLWGYIYTMTPAEPHPLRCETCENRYIPKCPLDYDRAKSNSGLFFNGKHWAFESCGCASHSSGVTADAVLEELEKWLHKIQKDAHPGHALYSVDDIVNKIKELRQQAKERDR